MNSPEPFDDDPDHSDDDADLIGERLDALLGKAPGPINWSTLPRDHAERQWPKLREWVEWFRREFGYDHRVVPPCWYEHRALVSVLSALRDHWTAAYDPLNAPSAASEWHRVLAVLEPRLREWAARTGCTAQTHRPDLLAEYPDDADRWRQHLATDLTTRDHHRQKGPSR